MGEVSDQGVRGPARPVVGWRYWQLAAGTSVLRSVSQRRWQWTPGRPLRAWCVGGGHVPPEPGCGCGIYASPDLDTLRAHGLCLAPEPLVVGTVALWGRVISEPEAHRGEWAYPRTLSVVADTVVDRPLAEVIESLARYGVAVGTTSRRDAVGEVSDMLIAHQAMSLRTRPVTG